jgi:hypothetical protein
LIAIRRQEPTVPTARQMLRSTRKANATDDGALANIDRDKFAFLS